MIDQSPGAALTPVVRRTYAPRGRTPIVEAWHRKGRVSAISAVTVSPVRRRPGLEFRLLADNLNAHGEDTVEQMAGALYRSLSERLLSLPDHLVLFPAHYSGSVCGRGLSSTPVSTIGFERRYNKALGIADRDAFIAHMLRDTPPRPPDAVRVRAENLGLELGTA